MCSLVLRPYCGYLEEGETRNVDRGIRLNPDVSGQLTLQVATD